MTDRLATTSCANQQWWQRPGSLEVSPDRTPGSRIHARWWQRRRLEHLGLETMFSCWHARACATARVTRKVNACHQRSSQTNTERGPLVPSIRFPMWQNKLPTSHCWEGRRIRCPISSLPVAYWIIPRCTIITLQLGRQAAPPQARLRTRAHPLGVCYWLQGAHLGRVAESSRSSS